MSAQFNPLFLPGVEIQAEAITENFGTIREADPDWRMVDSAGHGHFFAEGYPTLEERYRGCGDPDHDEDCEGESYYACPLCDEEIEPRTKIRDASHEVVGHRFTLTIRQGPQVTTLTLTEAEMKEVSRAASEAAASALAVALGEHGRIIEQRYGW
jgi:hypothetical protein